MDNEDIENNMVAEKIKNEMVDEVINLEEPEEINMEQKIKNQPVDEVHNLSDDSDNHIPSPEDSMADDLTTQNDAMLASGGVPNPKGGAGPLPQWDGYNPADYLNLKIEPEVKELFAYITAYTAENTELDGFLKPFIPDYIPAIGEVDGFLKIPRPDNEKDILGLSVIDEPKLNQSKKAVLDLILAEHGKLRGNHYKEVHSIANAHKNTKDVVNWVNNVEKIAKSKMAPQVFYKGNMPEIDTLMQAWEPNFEKQIRGIDIPENMDIPIDDYVKFACALLDIPVTKEAKESSLIEAMHVMFTLYNGFQSNQHFQNEGDNEMQSMAF